MNSAGDEQESYRHGERVSLADRIARVRFGQKAEVRLPEVQNPQGTACFYRSARQPAGAGQHSPASATLASTRSAGCGAVPRAGQNTAL
jgi:hypothetical protein